MDLTEASDVKLIRLQLMLGFFALPRSHPMRRKPRCIEMKEVTTADMSYAMAELADECKWKE